MALIQTDRTSRWAMRLALLMLGGGVAAMTTVLMGTSSDHGREGGTLVLDVITGGDGGRFGIVARQSRTSGSITGVWVAQGAAPEKGSRRAIEGQPVAAWRSGFPRLAWDGRQLRLFGIYERVTRQKGESCLAEAAGAWDLCIDPALVTFASLPR